MPLDSSAETPAESTPTLLQSDTWQVCSGSIILFAAGERLEGLNRVGQQAVRG